MDIVNARRDVARPYLKGKTPATLEDLLKGEGSDVQKKFLGYAYSLHDWAEKQGLVRPFAENAVASRLRYAWVFSTMEAGKWVENPVQPQ